VNLLLALVLLSSTFTNGATLPRPTGAIPCGGSGVSPELHWSNAPAGTRSFALIVHDPDAPAAGGFYHWVLYDIPPDTTTLPESAQIRANRSGRNGFGDDRLRRPLSAGGKGRITTSSPFTRSTSQASTRRSR
jgi:phosphatidylethanolamine-binding protein (PEBP) family uncharacterized protein